MSLRRLLAAALVCLTAPPALAGSDTPPESASGIPRGYADHVIHNANIYTGQDGDALGRWATAIAWRGEDILWVGRGSTWQSYVGPRTVVEDGHGATYTAGIVDAHEHKVPPFDSFPDAAHGRPFGDLCPVLAFAPDGTPYPNFDPTFDEVVSALQGCNGEASRRRSVILFGARFYATSKGHNLLQELSAASPNKVAVGFDATEGHGLWGNRLAFAAAGILNPSTDPNGIGVVDPWSGFYGRVYNPYTGLMELDGWAQELAQVPFFAALVSDLSDAQLAAVYQAGLDVALSQGVTSVTDIFFAGGPQKAAAVRALVNHPVDLTVACLPLAPGDVCPNSLRSRSGVLLQKYFASGAIKSCRGWSKQPYITPDLQCPSVSTPTWYGGPNLSNFDLEWAILSAGYDTQEYTTCTMIHTFGAASVEQVVTAAEKVERLYGTGQRLPRRCVTLEHADMANSSLRFRVALLGYAIIQNPPHLALRGDINSHYQPSEAADALRFDSLRKESLRFAFGGDEFGPNSTPPNVQIAALMDSVPAYERMTAEDAFVRYTRESAIARHEKAGLLGLGYPATLVRWDRNLLSGQAEDMRAAKPEQVIVRGKVAFSAP
ncbi:amidohydrolase family protein [Corallococcus sp. EGB]|uniref:amidohydrolase family protein n=1 Tax=Corallococcus sp. EGB TaxID=1521117 RepID=UPI001CC10F47|nr:amidohydrolase family protein [Corallococcus sp. EGB]